MARARAATSLSFTIGIAFATLVVTGGILAGPAVLNCSHQTGGFGACLRGKVIEGGFLPPDAPAPVPPQSAEAALAPGWIDANATEYEASTSGRAQLTAGSGRLEALGGLPSVEVSGEVALVDPGARINADGVAAAPGPFGDVNLAPITTGSIDVTGDGAVRSGLAGTTSIEPPSSPTPPQVTGRVGTAHAGQGRVWLAPQLVADLSPVPPLDRVVEPIVPKAPPQLMPRPVPAPPKAAAQVPPKPGAAPRPPKYDSRFPDVLVLPPPNTGENSSFATLEVR